MPAAAHLRVVFDTNIYISAFTRRRGPHFRIWQAGVQGRFFLLVSPAIVSELARVLREDFKWHEQEVQRTLRAVVKVAEVIATRPRLHVIVRDPEDNRILECALDGKADLIVSNDHHLLDLRTYERIPVIAGPDFRRTLGLA